jgi:hypothetical protein
MARVQVTRDDLQQVLASHHGNTSLTAAFTAAAPKPGRLLSVLGRYIQFNGAFGPGLANLVGEIAARQGLFRDMSEPVLILQDRAAEVAADFFFAAIDEFDDRATPWRDTHRTLAQATLKGLGRYFGYEPAALNDVFRMDGGTRDAMASVSEGYGLAASLSDERLFRSMGFHTGSEVLADEEFTIIDHILREKRPDVVKALLDTSVEILGSQHNAYYWISIHTSVEADHFDAAVRGVNNALRFYSGSEDLAVPKRWIIDGFRHFADVQAAFMTSLAAS